MAIDRIEFLAKLSEYWEQHPNQRFGQAAFNLMWELAPNLADHFRATSLDPFYKSEKVAEFVDACITLQESLQPMTKVEDRSL